MGLDLMHQTWNSGWLKKENKLDFFCHENKLDCVGLICEKKNHVKPLKFLS